VRFYRTVLKIEVLSEEPLAHGDMSLSDIDYAITEGHCSGVVTLDTEEEVDGPTMARLLIAQGSDPGFFGLTESGEESEE